MRQKYFIFFIFIYTYIKLKLKISFVIYILTLTIYLKRLSLKLMKMIYINDKESNQVMNSAHTLGVRHEEVEKGSCAAGWFAFFSFLRTTLEITFFFGRLFTNWGFVRSFRCWIARGRNSWYVNFFKNKRTWMKQTKLKDNTIEIFLK